MEQEIPASGILVSCIPKRKCSRTYYLTETFFYYLILFPDLSPISLWHLHFTIEFFKDPPFLLIDEMRGSDKPD